MPNDEHDLGARMDALTSRVEALERVLGAFAPAPSPPPPPAPRAAPARQVVPASAARNEARGQARARVLDRMGGASSEGGDGGASLERLVGGRVFAVVGALVVIAGAALFLKLAWDQGWFNLLPDVLKCIIAAAFGAGLLVSGEVVRRRIGALASLGLTAAGVGVLYATAYAAYGVFGLVSDSAGFVMLAATAGIGLFVGARARQASIAVLSLIGAYGVPFFFADTGPSPLVLPLYLLLLLGVALTLTAAIGGRFAALRALGWWGTVLIGGLWALDEPVSRLWLTLLFLGVSWALMHAEVALSAARSRLTSRRDLVDGSVSMNSWRMVRPFALLFGISAWATVIAVWAMGRADLEVWLAPAFGTVASGLLALWLGRGVRALTAVEPSDRWRLAVVLMSEAGAFLIATVALAFAGWMEVIAWLALGVAAVFAGRRLPARCLDLYGVVVLLIATGRLLVWDRWFADAATVGVEAGELWLSRWSALAAGAAAAWVLAALIIRRLGDWVWLCRGCAGVAMGLLMLSVVHERSEWSSVSQVWLLLSVAVFLLHGLASWMGLRVFALLGGLLCIGAWAAAYPWWQWGGSTAPNALHPGLGMALTIAAGLAGGGWVVRRDGAAESPLRSFGVAMIVCAVGLTLLATSLEVSRIAERLTNDQTARRAAVSIWWGVYAIGLLWAGFVSRIGSARRAGLVLLAVATAKAVLFDLAGVSAGWRVASFITLGLLMLGVGLAYAVLSSRVAARGERA